MGIYPLLSFCYRLDGRDRTLTVNLGNLGEFTMREMATQVLRLTGSSSKLSFQPLPQDDPKQRYPNITRAR